MDLLLPGEGWERGILEILGWHTHNTIFTIESQQGPTVEHRELCLIFYINFSGKRIWKIVDTCITESLCCIPETNKALLINDILM